MRNPLMLSKLHSEDVKIDGDNISVKYIDSYSGKRIARWITIDLKIFNDGIREIIRSYILSYGGRSSQTKIVYIRKNCEFVNEFTCEKDFLKYSYEEYMKKYEEYSLNKYGKIVRQSKTSISVLYSMIEEKYRSTNEYDNDTWDVNNFDFPIKIPKNKKLTRIVFTCFSSAYFKEYVKKYIFDILKKSSYASAITDMKPLKIFYHFLKDNYEFVLDDLSLLNREIMKHFIIFIKKSENNSRQTYRVLYKCRSFLNYLYLDCHFLNCDKLILKSEMPKCYIEKRLDPFTPEEEESVIKCYQYLDELSRDMLFVMHSLGLRPADTSTLTITDLIESNNGCRLNVYMNKVNRYNVIEINKEDKYESLELSDTVYKILKKNIDISIEKFKEKAIYIFQKNEEYPFNVTEDIMPKLQKVIKAHNILDRNGEPLHAYGYRFRYTFGTNAINKYNDPHLVKELLGHSNLNTQLYYTRYSPATIMQYKKPYFDQLDKLLKCIGDESLGVRINSENEYVRKTAVGGCTLVNSNSCNSGAGNGCLKCNFFKPINKAYYLESISLMINDCNKDIEIARLNGFDILLESNIKLLKTLEKIKLELLKSNISCA